MEPKVSSDMPLRKWYQILCQRNPHFESYQRPYNNSWLVFDKSVPLEALDIHNELVTSSSSTTTPYLALTVHNYPKDNSTSTWVPLLVGYTVIILWKKKLLRLAITKDSNNNLIYMYEDYEDDISLTDCVHRSSHRNFFHGLIHYLNIDGRVSIPALIGLNILEIVIQLRNVINMTFPNLFTQVKQAHNAIVTTNRIKNKMKRKASSLCENLENNISTSTTSNTVKINSGILISSNGLPMTPKSTQALVCEYASELNEKRNLKKKLKRTENKLVEHEQAMNPFIVNLQENKENIEITPILEEFDLLLDIGIDGDLESNKTLGTVAIVNQIFADLKHVAKLIRSKIVKNVQWRSFEQVIMQYFNGCIYAAGARKADKEIDTPSEDELKKIQEERQANRERNNEKLAQKTKEKGEKILNQRNELESFDFSQELVPYGRQFQKRIQQYEEFTPSFACYIKNFSTTVKCICCRSFPKYTSSGLCKLCNYYIQMGYHDRIINESYQPTSKLPVQIIPPDQFILQHIFQFSSFRLYQREVIQSYTQGQDVFALIQTGGGKTFCYAASSLIFSGLIVVISPLKALILDQVNELIKVGIPCAGLYATTGQSLEYQEKVFQEIASKMLKILLITPEKLMLNQGFRNMLRKVHGEIGVRFVIDEAHCILEYNHYRPEWGKLGCLKEFFPSTSILLLTATCSQDDAEVIRQNLNINSVNFNVIRSSCFSRPEIEYIVKKKSTRERNLVEIAKIVNEISDGQCIIYCSSPGICNEILPLLQDKLKGTAIGTYHGGLESFERDQVMLQWKSRLLKVMIATNAFGLGVNSPNIRTVVHYTFPSSISNFIQESGRAGRDGNPAQSILFYSRNDIKTVYTIITGGRESDFDNNESTSLERTQYLNKGQRKIFEMVTYCESIYECRAQQLAAYHSWQSDSKIPRCTKCDCCINYFKDLPKSENIKNDVIHLLKVIIAVTEFLGMRNQLTLPIDIIHVFAKANNNNIKEKQLSSLPIYKQDYNKTLRRFEDISRLLDNLIIKNLVKDSVILFWLDL
ncbi:unnamed protein product [Rhizophagus irregularis]|uniref:DNA 3'-5' helicase n=1 Tax=Rhizophagus irregularis TaxID=588596 RepID=A0A915YXT6_9GLOM|nr:unnamed protein product [Rhizophagus irregularis]